MISQGISKVIFQSCLKALRTILISHIEQNHLKFVIKLNDFEFSYILSISFIELENKFLLFLYIAG